MPATAQSLAIGGPVLFFLGPQLCGALGLRLILRVPGIRAKCRQQACCALDLVLVIDPDTPTLAFLIFKLVFDTLHVQVITKGTGAQVIRQMPDQSHNTS